MKMSEITEIDTIRFTTVSYYRAEQKMREILASYHRFNYYNGKPVTWEIDACNYIYNKENRMEGIRYVFAAYTKVLRNKISMPTDFYVIAEVRASIPKDGNLNITMKKKERV